MGRYIVLAFSFLCICRAQAETFPVTARLFIGQLDAKVDNINTEMAAQNLKKFDGITVMGIEATYAQSKFFEYGFRYTKRVQREDESPDNPATDYFGKIDQDSVLLLTRVPVIRNDIVRTDIFAGVGGSNTKFSIHTAGEDGDYTRKEAKDWFASPCASAGASFGVGFKKFYFVMEVGYDYNRVSSFKHSGSVNGNISALDLSGPYFTVGLMFDGVPASKK